jgi:hypothetical protein
MTVHPGMAYANAARVDHGRADLECSDFCRGDDLRPPWPVARADR